MPHLKINKKLEKFLTTSKQIKVAIGGRGSGKSIGFGDMLTYKMQTEQVDVYCLREFQDSLNDSVHRVFKASIENRLNLKGWDVQENKVVSPYGNKTTYKGASRNPDSIQSAADYRYSWFEEAHRASQESIDKLLPTILRTKGAECWFSANPQSSKDPFSQRFIEPYKQKLDRDGYYEDKLHLIMVVNWRDNPWWNDEQENLRVWDLNNTDRARYDWIWEGKYNDGIEDAIIKPEWFDAAIDAHKLDKLKKVFKPHGARIAAFDPSDGGDNAGYVLRHGSILEKIKEKLGAEIDESCDWATGQAIQDGADVFVWDGDGMGAGLKRQIADAFEGKKIRSRIFKGSLRGKGQDNADQVYQRDGQNPTTYADTFLNNRSQRYTNLADRFYNTYKCVIKGEYIDPDEMISINSEGVENLTAFRSEVCRIPKKDHPNGLIQIRSKIEMKALGIDSPGMADSAMMSTIAPPSVRERKPIKYNRSGIV